MDSGENFDRNRILNFFAFFMESLSLYAQSIVRQNRDFVKKFKEDFQIAEMFDAINDRLSAHPPLKFLVFALAFSCAIPVIMFIAFGIITVFITFIGFLCVEGALLAVGGLCMFACVITMALVLSVVGMMLGVFYMVAVKFKEALHKLETPNEHPKELQPMIQQSEN